MMNPGMIHEVNGFIKELMLERMAVGQDTLQLKNFMKKFVAWEHLDPKLQEQIEHLYKSVINDYIEHFKLFLNDPEWQGNLQN